MTDPITPREIFSQMAAFFDPSKADGVNATFQYNLSGPNGGSWYISIENMQCEVSEGQVENPSTTFNMSDDTFVAISTGDTSPMIAYSMGKLQLLGNPMKAASLMKMFNRPE